MILSWKASWRYVMYYITCSYGFHYMALRHCIIARSYDKPFSVMRKSGGRYFNVPPILNTAWERIHYGVSYSFLCYLQKQTICTRWLWQKYILDSLAFEIKPAQTVHIVKILEIMSWLHRTMTTVVCQQASCEITTLNMWCESHQYMRHTLFLPFFCDEYIYIYIYIWISFFSFSFALLNNSL